MNAIKFGYLTFNKQISFDFGTIVPSDELLEIVKETEEKKYSKNNLFYPPTHAMVESTNGVDWQDIPNSTHSPDLFKFVYTHELIPNKKSSSTLTDFGENPSFYLLQVISYLFGMRCIPEEFWFFGKIPKKNNFNVLYNEKHYPDFLNIALQTWSKFDSNERIVLTNILQFFNSIVAYSWYWVKFNYEYMVFDAMWHFKYEDKCGKGKKKLKRVLEFEGITYDSAVLKEIVDYRNFLIHELTWPGEVFINKNSDTKASLFSLMRKLNHRLVGKLLGFQGDYYSTSFHSRGTYKIDLSNARQQ